MKSRLTGGETPITPDGPGALDVGDVVEGLGGRWLGDGFVECGGLFGGLWGRC